MGIGFIKLFRDIQEHWLWEDKPYARGQAWIDLLMMANFADSKTIRFGQIQIVKRGQILTSEQALADKWGWNRRKVQRFLERLEADEMLTRKGTAQGTTLSIVNYRLFQGEGATKGTTEGQREGNECAHNKKGRREEGKNLRNLSNLLTESIPDIESVGESSTPPPTPKSKKVTIETLEEALANRNYSDSLKQTLSTWLRYREEIKKPFKTMIGFEKLLTQISGAVDEYGETKVIDLINEGMGQGWQGIIFERLKKQEGASNVQNDRGRTRADKKDQGAVEDKSELYGTYEWYEKRGLVPAKDEGTSGNSEYPFRV